MPQIIITQSGDPESRTVPCGVSETTIGRAPDNTVVLVGDNISRHHAVITAHADDFFLTDLGSGNGTLLNGTPIRSNERYVLRNGDVATIAQYHVHFSRADTLEQSFNELTDSEILEVKLLKKVLGALDKDTLPSLEVMNGAAAGKRLMFDEAQDDIVVGRDADAELSIEEYVVSRRHARIARRDGGLVAEDLDSKNGTYVNNRRITSAALHDGDRIAFGTIVCIFRNPREVNLDTMSEAVREHRRASRPPPPPKVAKPAAPAEEPSDTLLPEAVATDQPTGASESALADPGYPTPQPARSLWDRFSPAEMGMLWGGIVIFLVTAVLLVRLLA